MQIELTTTQRIQEWLGQKIPPAEMARRLGITRQAVYKQIDKIKGKAPRQVMAVPTDQAQAHEARQVVEDIAGKQINVLGQLQEANNRLWGIVQRMTPPEGNVLKPMTASVIIRALGEVRAQLELQAKLIEMLHNVEAVKEFQEEVLTAISEADPDVAQKIKQRLSERRAVRGLVGRPG